MLQQDSLSACLPHLIQINGPKAQQLEQCVLINKQTDRKYPNYASYTYIHVQYLVTTHFVGLDVHIPTFWIF